MGRSSAIVIKDLKLLRDLLIGEFCFGDDGENAEIKNVWYNTDDDRMYIDILQEDGVEYQGIILAYYLDEIDTDKETLERVKDILENYS